MIGAGANRDRARLYMAAAAAALFAHLAAFAAFLWTIENSVADRRILLLDEIAATVAAGRVPEARSAGAGRGRSRSCRPDRSGRRAGRGRQARPPSCGSARRRSCCRRDGGSSPRCRSRSGGCRCTSRGRPGPRGSLSRPRRRCRLRDDDGCASTRCGCARSRARSARREPGAADGAHRRHPGPRPATRRRRRGASARAPSRAGRGSAAR